MRKSYKLENLGCANCAAKMETGIGKIPGVNKASVNFLISKLTIDAAVDTTAALSPILDKAQAVCSSYERDCIIVR